MRGHDLLEALASPLNLPQALIQDFLYARTPMLITGEAGKGKSVISMQIALSLSSATPLFGALPIAQPCRVYFMQMEGLPEAALERMKYQAERVRLDPDYLYWDANKRTRLNCLELRSMKSKLDEIAGAFDPYPPDLVTIDPIYKAVGGADLADAHAALSLIDFCDRLLDRFRASSLLIHHPHREKYTAYGKKIDEPDSFYGHSYLKNYVEVAYVFRQLTTDGEEAELSRTKMREEHSLEHLPLRYHPETYSCSMPIPPSHGDKTDAIRALLKECALAQRRITMAEIRQRIPVTPQFLRTLRRRFMAEGWLDAIWDPGKPTIWVPKLTPNDSNTSTDA